MNIAEYAKALSKLPINFKVLPHQEVSICEYSGFLIAVNCQYPPIYFKNGEWYEMQLGQAA